MLLDFLNGFVWFKSYFSSTAAQINATASAATLSKVWWCPVTRSITGFVYPRGGFDWVRSQRNWQGLGARDKFDRRFDPDERSVKLASPGRRRFPADVI